MRDVRWPWARVGSDGPCGTDPHHPGCTVAPEVPGGLVVNLLFCLLSLHSLLLCAAPLMASCQSSALTVSCAHRLVVASHGPQEKVQAPSWGLKTSLALSPAAPPSTCSSDMGFSVGTSFVTPTVIPFPFLFTLFGLPSRFPFSLLESYSSLRLREWILSRSLSLTIPVHPSQPPALSPHVLQRGARPVIT